MKTVQLNIIKKNRKYFAATHKGYKVKILINENSESLKLGEQTLTVDDISVRSKYGTDVIYKLAVDAEPQESQGIVSLRAPYNLELIEKCRNLGGTWDKETQAWIFPDFVADKVEDLEYKYGSELVAVEVEFTEFCSADKKAFDICGIVLATASGRDSGAKLADGVAVISGGFSSGGSVKNWRTCVADNTIVRLKVPSQLVEDFHGLDLYFVTKVL